MSQEENIQYTPPEVVTANADEESQPEVPEAVLPTESEQVQAQAAVHENADALRVEGRAMVKHLHFHVLLLVLELAHFLLAKQKVSKFKHKQQYMKMQMLYG